MPLLDDNTQEKERHRPFGGCDAHDADTLANGFPHDGFGVVKFETNNVGCLFANAIVDSD